MKAISLALLSILFISLFVFSTQASSSSFTIATPLGHGYDPNVQSVGSNVYVAWTDRGNGILFRVSNNSGLSWAKQVAIGGGGSYPIMSASGSNVYVIWTAGAITFTKSSNYGGSWSKPMRISPVGAITPYIASNGALVAVVYLIPGKGSYVTASSDSGAHWTTPYLYSNGPECQVAVSGTNIYAVADKLDRSHIQFAVSQNSGSTWNVNSTGLPGGSEAWIVASGSNVYSVWETKSPQSVVYFLWSTNNGNTLNTKIISTGMPDAWNPMINVYGSNIWVGFEEFGSKAQNWMLTSTDGGSTWKSTSLTGLHYTNGFIFNIATTDGSNLFAMWIQKSGTGSAAVTSYSTDGGTTWTNPVVSLGVSDPNADVAIGSISSNGSHGFAAWQYNSTIYFSGS